jgi:hypothetical protein
MAADQLQILYRAVLANDGVEPHDTLNARLLCQRRIDRLRLPDQVRLLHLAAHADALHHLLLLLNRRRWRWRSRSRHRSDNAANHAARSAARHATRHATHYTG